MARAALLRDHYPWTTTPLIVSAPMRLIAGPALVKSVTGAGGLGFVAAGTDTSTLAGMLDELGREFDKAPATRDAPAAAPILPLGIGFINWGADLATAVAQIARWRPAAAWFFAPAAPADLATWARAVRDASAGATRIWVQVGTVTDARAVAASCAPDVLVVQGSDAGGHGLARSASLMTLLPECADALRADGFGDISLIAAGGISDARTGAAATVLGADGLCLGTRLLATPEAQISAGYRQAVLDAQDGGLVTVRTTVYDRIRGTPGWPAHYDGRGVINASFRDYEAGMPDDENTKLYETAVKEWGDRGWGAETGRITTYAGTGVGLVREVKPAADVVREIQEGMQSLSAKSML